MTNSDNNISEAIIRLMMADKSVDAPADSVRWAKNVFRSRVAEAKPSLLQKIKAVLQIDLSPQQAALGERSGSMGQARQMLFDAGGHSIDLRVTEVGDALAIQGQIIGEGFARSFVELSSGKNTYSTQASEMSEFKFTGVTPGTYVFRAMGGETELEIETLELN